MIHIELSNDIRLVYDTARYLSDVALSFGVPKDKHNALCFLLETALQLRTDELDDADATLAIDAFERNAKLVISVTDKGLPYMPTDDQLRIFNNAKLGRLVFDQLGSEGQRLSFLVDQSPDYVMPVPPAHREEALLDSDVSCRRTATDSEDILEAIRCLYEVYGYSYLHQYLYHSDEFKRLLQSGRYISALAENTHHQVLGHAALEEHEWFCGLSEICNLVVKPLARGLGISGKLCEYLIDLAVHEKTGNLYGLPVLHHPISQKLLNRAGFVPCGLCASLMDMRDIQGYEDSEGRASAAVCALNVVGTVEPALYLPEECHDFVRDILGQLQMTWHEGTGPSDNARETRLSYNADSVHHYIEVKIDSIGSDLYERLQSLYEQLKGDIPNTATIYLNARDPQCPACYAFLRAEGFAFGGCLPGARGGDYLILQLLSERTFGKEGVAAEPNYERMLERLYQINGW